MIARMTPLRRLLVLLVFLSAAALVACGPTTSQQTKKDTDTDESTQAGADGDGSADDGNDGVESSGVDTDVELIPRTLLFGNPISPDGKRVAFLAPKDGVLNVWVASLEGLEEKGADAVLEAAEPITNDTGRGIRSYRWAWDDTHILYIQDKDGDENWHVYATNVETAETRDLTPFDGVQARISEVSPEHPNEILLAINKDNPQLHDVYRVALDSGEMELVARNEGFLALLTTHELTVPMAIKPTPTGGMTYLVKEGDGDETTWRELFAVGPEDAMSTSPVFIDPDGQEVWVVDSRKTDTTVLAPIDLKTGERRDPLAGPYKADIDDVVVHPTKHRIQAVTSTFARTRRHSFDRLFTKDMDFLDAAADGEWSITSRSRDDTRWLVAYENDDGPVEYYLYERTDSGADEEEITRLFSSRPALEDVPLAPMHDVVIESRDLRPLVSYYTLPLWTDEDADGQVDEGVADAGLPMVLLVHGGPWHRDSWGYNAMHQWLANRGYAVLSVNFRGSTGFGKDFVNAANKEWAGQMHDDLLDAVDWAVAQGIANPNEVAIMGGSYGGYATLVGLTFTPKRFAAGVDIVGPSNLVTLLENVPPYWMPLLPLLTSRVGDPSTEKGRKFLLERSPLSKVDAIERPLLIGQGANDPRVKQQESDQIVEAMQKKNIPVQYVLFPDEGHGFARPENRLAFFAITEQFLAEHIGGRAEPIGDAVEQSSAKIVTE